MGFSGRTKFSSDRLSSGLERHRAPVRRVLRWLVLSLLACLGLRYLLVMVFAPYAEQIDYGVEAVVTAAAAYTQWLVIPRRTSPSLRLRWTLWILYLAVRAHLVGLAALGLVMPHISWLRGYLLTTHTIAYTAFLFAMVTPSFTKGPALVRRIEIGLGVILTTTLMMARLQFQEGGSQVRYFLFIFCYQVFVVISAQTAVRASSSIAEYNFCRRIVGYSVALLVTASVSNYLSMHSDLPIAWALDGVTGLEALVLVWITSRGYVLPSRPSRSGSLYAVRSGLPMLMTLAIAGLSIFNFQLHPALSVVAILLAIVGYGWRMSILMSQHLVVRDELMKAQSSLRELAYIDALTGAGNRRSFEQRLQEERLRQLKTGEEFSLLLFDIDKFKVLNDSLGHPFGDACLKLLVDVARRIALRSGDHLARLGGDEFGLILTGTNLQGARMIAQRLQHELALASADLKAPLAISIGVATSESGASTSLEALVGAADEDLYRAKKAGGSSIKSIAADNEAGQQISE